MMIRDIWKSPLVGWCAALAGAYLFYLIGFPTAALTGSAAAVSVVGLAGVKTDLPIWLRNTAFVFLGVNIGSAVTPEMLAASVQWPLSIAILAISLTLGLALGSWGLVRLLGYTPGAAVLAAAPGHLSFVMGLASDGRYPVAAIAVIQSIRVLFLTLCVPVLVTSIFGATGAVLLPGDTLDWVPLIGLLVISGAAGWCFQRIRVPAGFLIGGMVMSALGHAIGLTPGKLHPVLLTASLLCMGVLIGSRFSGVSLRDFRKALSAGVMITLLNVAMALGAVVATLLLMEIPASQLIVAFAPGGVEAMSAIGLTLGMDPAFVAAHHLSRLVILSLLIPFAMHWARKFE